MQQGIPARLVLQMPFLRPGTYARKVECPILFALCAICATDNVAPARMSHSHASKAPRSTIKWYQDMDHSNPYVGEKHDRAFADYTEFLKTHFPA